MLSVSERTICRWLSKGKLRGYVVEGAKGLKKWHVDPASVRDCGAIANTRQRRRRSAATVLAEEVRQLREENEQYRVVLGQLAERLAEVEATMRRLLPAAPQERRAWWRKMFWRRRETP
jgi:hypothetical protein